MKKLLLAIVALVLAPAAWAQFTTVTGTVIDPNGVPYAFGTITANLPTNGVTPLINGNQFSGVGSAGLDRTGSFTVQLADNSMMVPSGLKWVFTVCSGAGTVNPAFGTGSQCFTPAPITISGATQSITTQLHAAATALTLPFGTGTGTIGGSGTPGSIPLFTAPMVLGNSLLTDNGTNLSYAGQTIAGPNSAFSSSLNGTLGIPSVFSMTGTPLSGGSSATTLPFAFIDPGAASISGWNTNGTLLGLAKGLFTGDIINVLQGGPGPGGSIFKVDNSGNVTVNSLTLDSQGSGDVRLNLAGPMNLSQAHIQGNTDVTGQITITAGNTTKVCCGGNFGVNYFSTGPPIVVLTPTSNVPVGTSGIPWVTYGGSPANWTEFTINIAAALVSNATWNYIIFEPTP